MVHSLPVALTALLLCFAFSGAAAAGFNLSWDDCGSHGSSLKTFTCDTDAGYQDLIVSVVVQSPLEQFHGVEALLRMHTEVDIPDWWRLDTGQCRSGLLSLGLDFAAEPTSCANPFGPGLAGVLLWDIPFDPRDARLRMAAATPAPNPIGAGIEYTMFRVRIPNALTSTCTGCGVPACIAIQYVRLAQPAGVGDVFLYVPESRGVVGWQCPSWGYVTDSPYICLIEPRCVTSATSPTWGSIKMLYR